MNALNVSVSILIAIAAISAGLIWPAWSRRHLTGVRTFIIFSVAVMLWCVVYALELVATTLPAKLFLVKIQYISITHVAVFFLTFSLQYTNHPFGANRKRFLFYIVPWLTLIAVWLEPNLGYFYTSIGLDVSGPFPNFDPEYGPLFWTLIGYSYLCLTVGAILLIRFVRKASPAYRDQLKGIIIATIFPWLGNFVFVTGLSPQLFLDLTPVGFGLTAIALGWSIRRARLLDITPIAHEVILKSMNDAVFVFNKGHFLVELNPPAANIVNLQPTEAIGRHLDELFVDHLAPLRAAKKQHEGSREVNLGIGKGQSDFHRMSLTNIYDRVGNAHGRLLILHNVNQQKKTVQALDAQKQLFKNLVNIAHAITQSPDLQTTLNSTISVTKELSHAQTGSILLVENDQSASLDSLLSNADVSSKEKQIIQTTIMEDGLAGWIQREKKPVLINDTQMDDRWLQLPEQTYEARSVLSVPITHKDELLGIITLTHPDPSHFTNSQLELINAAAAQIALAIRNAQTYKAKQELVTKLSTAKEQAEAANRAKSAFLAHMSHEWRTPLTAIIGYCELIEEIDAANKYRHITPYLHKIHTSATHLSKMVNDVLDISKIDANKLNLHWESCDLQRLLDIVVDTVQPLLEDNSNTLSVNCAAEIGRFYTDPTRLRQILINLLSNAAKFTEDGHVILDIRLQPNQQRDKNDIVFTISDTGIGMTPMQVSQLFKPFVQFDASHSRKHGGTGLGLAISYRFVQMLGGTLTVESRPNEGSTFTCTLPLHTTSPKVEKQSPEFPRLFSI